MALNFGGILGQYDKNYSDEFFGSETEAGFGPAGTIKNVQHGTITIGTGDTSNTATITSVVTANSIVVSNGFKTNAISVSAADHIVSRVDLTNSTTVTATRNTQSGSITSTITFIVIEYESGIVKSIQNSSGTTGGVTIQSVDTTKSYCFLRGGRSTDTTGDQEDVIFNIRLSAATTVTVGESGSLVVYFVVVEFN